jgi:C4-dicarboxylate transporter DctM subunit
MFLLMGQFATHGGLSHLLFRFVNAFLGHLRGGLALATVGACAGFGAICGSSIATAATMAQVAYPQMRKFGYSGTLSTGSIAAGGTLGILIPPSVPLVVYAILTNESIGKLFVAAILPGSDRLPRLSRRGPLACAARPDGRAGRTARDLAGALARDRSPCAPVVIIFAAVVVSIYGGWSSPTEASAVGAVVTFLLATAHGMR